MLLSLLVNQLAKPSAPRAAPRGPITRTNADAVNVVLQATARKISEQGKDTLTDAEKRIWNTAVVIFFMTGDSKINVPPDARVTSWGAAAAGFREMGHPKLAECVRSMVVELAYRADLHGRDQTANSASLLRIAELKRNFQTIEAEVDLSGELGELIHRLYESG